MKFYKKKSSHHKSKHTEKATIESITRKSICQMNCEEYIGQVVTVYVNAGGKVGNGFTGFLLEQTNTYIRLMIIPSLQPSCSLKNGCNGNIDNNILCLSCPFNKNAALGAIAEISIDSISAFVHSNLKLSLTMY